MFIAYDQQIESRSWYEGVSNPSHATGYGNDLLRGVRDVIGCTPEVTTSYHQGSRIKVNKPMTNYSNITTLSPGEAMGESSTRLIMTCASWAHWYFCTNNNNLPCKVEIDMRFFVKKDFKKFFNVFLWKNVYIHKHKKAKKPEKIQILALIFALNVIIISFFQKWVNNIFIKIP